MPIVRSGSGRQEHLPPGLPSELRPQSACLDANLLHVLHRNQTARASERAERLRLSQTGTSTNAYTRLNSEVRGDAIDSEVVGVGSLSPDAELPWGIE